MRFPRHSKVFRGQIDIVPLANVIFLLLIFILLASLIYTPGIPIQLSSDEDLTGSGGLVSVSRKGEISYEGKVFKIDEIEELRRALKALPEGEKVVLKTDPGAPRELVTRIRQTLENGINLALSETYAGTDNPTLAVAVNWRGQLFYDNQLVSKTDLKTKLEKAMGQSKGPFTLLVMPDKSVEASIMAELRDLARQVGIKHMIWQVQPRISGTGGPSSNTAIP